jgi:hypothetical protein
MQHSQILSVTERLNLSAEVVSHIQEVVLFGWYQAYAVAPNSNAVNNQVIINDIFTEFSGKELAAALYILGTSEAEPNSQDVRQVITELFLAAYTMFGTIKLTFVQFKQAAYKVQEFHSMEVVGNL